MVEGPFSHWSCSNFSWSCFYPTLFMVMILYQSLLVLSPYHINSKVHQIVFMKGIRNWISTVCLSQTTVVQAKIINSYFSQNNTSKFMKHKPNGFTNMPLLLRKETLERSQENVYEPFMIIIAPHSQKWCHN